MSKPRPEDPVTHMQLREYLLQYVPVEELSKYPTLVELAEKTEGVATVEELRAQGHAMMADFEAKYAAREAKYETYTLVAWAAAIRHEMQQSDAQAAAKFRAEMAELRGEFARSANTIIETLRAEIRACMEPINGVPERVTKLEEELVPRVERLEARVFAPKSRRAAPRSRTRTRRR